MTYEYACEACGHHWEAEQSIKDAPLKTCSACGKESAKRLVSGGTGFLLKGGGWYADGYGSKSSSSSSSSDAPAKASSGDSSSTSTPSTKTESGAKSSAPSETAAPKTESTKAASSPST